MISKFIAAQENGLRIELRKKDKVLYLGASHGTTAKIISEMVEWVFCVEISKTSMKELLKVCEERKNMIPLLNDANKPEEYKKNVPKVDVVYQDIAQKNQVNIFVKNVKTFLKKKGTGILIVKTQSIDSVREREEILKEAINGLREFKTIESRSLEPFYPGHYCVVIQVS